MNEYLAHGPAEIGKAVRQRRQEMKLTQANAAGLCNVGIRFLSELENGKPTLHLGKVMKVLRAFGLMTILKRKGIEP
ncbi:MAG: helix-turn-helix transcriptional regulator [Elusimicrobiota bacterium]|jgi:y4mF family transcriptional regulator